MSYESKRDEMCKVAMQIILHAGDAKMMIEASLDAAKDLDFEKADMILEKARKEIIMAHEAQTVLVQREASGEEYPNSLLFNHAQDTLMNSMNLCDMAEKNIQIFKSLYNRMIRIEQKI